MNVNIFLKKLRMSNDKIIDKIRAGESEDMGAEMIRGLIKILPEEHELEAVRSFDGDVSTLGAAEQFFLAIGSLPACAVRLKWMLQIEEVPASGEVLRTQIKALQCSCDGILKSTSLKRFLALVLRLGNFLNMGSYAGDAKGFRVSSLNSLTEIRSNKPRMNFLHYICDVAEKESPDVLEFVSELPELHMASRLSIDDIDREVKELSKDVTSLKNSLKTSPEDVHEKFYRWLKPIQDEVTDLRNRMSEVRSTIVKLAQYFCEDEKIFRVEECLSSFHMFTEKLKQCQKENLERVKAEERAAKRAVSLTRGKQIVPEAGEDCIVDKLLSDIKRGEFKLKKTRGF